MKKKAPLLIVALVALLFPSCSFTEGQEPLAAAAAVAGSRNVIGAEVDVLGWRRIGAGIWIQKPSSQ